MSDQSKRIHDLLHQVAQTSDKTQASAIVADLIIIIVDALLNDIGRIATANEVMAADIRLITQLMRNQR